MNERESCIPALQPEFLESPWYRGFHTQRLSHPALLWSPVLTFHIGPIIDPAEFRTRFMASLQGQPGALGPIGALLSMILVTWATSYGIDEYGRDTVSSTITAESSEKNLAAVDHRRAKVNEMVAEMLNLIDRHGLLRRPSWDGVRVLMLILPLTEGACFFVPLCLGQTGLFPILVESSSPLNPCD